MSKNFTIYRYQLGLLSAVNFDRLTINRRTGAGVVYYCG